MVQQEEELHGKAKLAFEASVKIFQGQKLSSEGTFELNNLFGEHSLKKSTKSKKGKLTPGQKSAITKKKLIAHRDSTFKKDTRSDEKIMDKMVQLVRVNRQASTVLFKKRLHLGERRLNKLLGVLQGQGRLLDESKGDEGGHHKWVLPKGAKKTKAKEKKTINGHNFKKAAGNGGKRIGGPMIDVTTPEYVSKAIDLMKTDDWVTNGKLIEEIDVSAGVVNRLTTYMKKEKMIKEVIKKHNPAHKNSPKNFERPLRYWAVA